MTSFAKKLQLSMLLIAATAAAPAMADPVEHTIKLSATVPTATFHVLPTQDDWINDVQRLNYNPVTTELSSLVKQFTVLNTAGGITGRLSEPAVLTSGGTTIPLTVNFGALPLTNVAQVVVTAAAAATSHQVNLQIVPVRPTTGPYVAGNYTGNVALEFDAAP